MTNKDKSTGLKQRKSGKKSTLRRSAASQWLLRDAKAHFSELIRRAKAEGPQHVTVYGREEVVVVAAEDFRRMKGDLTGKALIDVLRNAPLQGVDIEPRRDPMPVRDVSL